MTVRKNLIGLLGSTSTKNKTIRDAAFCYIMLSCLFTLAIQVMNSRTSKKRLAFEPNCDGRSRKRLRGESELQPRCHAPTRKRRRSPDNHQPRKKRNSGIVNQHDDRNKLWRAAFLQWLWQHRTLRIQRLLMVDGFSLCNGCPLCRVGRQMVE